MSEKILIKTPGVKMKAVLNKSKTAREIALNLPLRGSGRLWGDEIYFEIPVELPPENPQETVEIGDLAYWPEGAGFCIFFGPTPLSKSNEIRPASGVNVIGKLDGKPEELKKYTSGDEVVIEKV